jgi:spoIIIJ-associated protein
VPEREEMNNEPLPEVHPEAAVTPSEPFVEDGRADTALDFVIDVLAAMGMDCTVDLLENSEEDPPEEIRLEIEGRDAGRIIGKKGQTLAALQFLANRIVNRPAKPRRHVIVDAEGYRARREDALTSMAQRLGKQAVEEGKIITFEPMSPQDRRVVHLALAKYPGVVTKSDGEGESRRVQIIPVRR